ncbi:MAG: hypothetical protein RI996_464 [Candidatus Parcubacteria bacterium]|jgi:SET domain-containing protein
MKKKISTHQQTILPLTEREPQKRVVKDESIPVRYKVGKSFAGLGLFATEHIKKGETIIQYLGHILNDDEACKKINSMYLFEVKKNINIDGTPRWNTARYANYSCDPNAESENRKNNIYLVAIKNIKAGDEITFDYGEEFFNEHIKPKGCRCGTKKCKSNI